MDKNCIKCGQPAIYKEGNKNGKPWAAYFCQDKDNCGNVEWVKLKTNEPAVVKASTIPPKNGGKEINADMMELAYRKDLMVAIVSSGNIDPIATFKELWAVVKNG